MTDQVFSLYDLHLFTFLAAFGKLRLQNMKILSRKLKDESISFTELTTVQTFFTPISTCFVYYHIPVLVAPTLKSIYPSPPDMTSIISLELLSMLFFSCTELSTDIFGDCCLPAATEKMKS